MIYIVSLFICLIIDRIDPQKYKLYRGLLVCWVIVFLCFGYMTGSDWRNYELIYNGVQEASRDSIFESGFSFLLKLFHHIINDFWVFNALCKIAYFGSFILFIQCFTNKVWTTVGVAFVFSLLFLLIDCPMRFMMALMFIQFGIHAIVNKKIGVGIVMCAISVFFHITSLLVISLLLSFFIFRRINCLPSALLIIIYIVALILPSIPAVFERLYSGLSFLSLFERYQEEYNDYEVQTFTSIGFWKNAVLGLFLIISKKHVLRQKYGDILFYYSYIYFALSGILSCIPTGFRLGILNGFFFVAVIVNLINQRDYLSSAKPIINIIGVIALIVLLSHTVKDNWKYTPYSNSIKYILTEHLPYSYRDTYNYSNNF